VSNAGNRSHRQVVTTIPMDPHLFYELDGGHALLRTALPARAQITVGELIPLSCMFDAYWLLVRGERVGYLFTTSFQVKNSGGFICAFMEAKRGAADRVEVLLKTDDCVIYNFPNKGTLVISPAIAEEVTTIFDEQ
jgi:hypothetical protein